MTSDDDVLEVIRPGVLTTVQDMGRPGYLADGIPPSGAFDTAALKLANLLVGNAPGDYLLVGQDPGAAGLEMTLRGPALRALRDTVIAFTGADMPLTVNGEQAPGWTAIPVHAGDEIAIGPARGGLRGYLAVAGGSPSRLSWAAGPQTSAPGSAAWKAARSRLATASRRARSRRQPARSRAAGTGRIASRGPRTGLS
jgi:hypothetical protein